MAQWSRPLRTGKSFVLVIPSRRVVARRFDQTHYQPGDECRLSVLGRGLGKEPLSIAVESENEDGTWTPVAKLRAEVDAKEGEALVSWRFPTEPVTPGVATVRETDGSILSHAKFEDHRDLETDGAVWMLASAPGLEGTSVQVVLEREGEPGEWLSVGEAVATVKSDGLRTSVTPGASSERSATPGASRDPAGPAPLAPEADEADADESPLPVSDARFDDPRDLAKGGPVWLVARAAGLDDGRGVKLVLERQDPSGAWVPVGEAVATVRSGAVRAAVTPDSDETDPPQT